MKRLKCRYNPKTKRWYGFVTDSEIKKVVEKIPTEETREKLKDEDRQQELKQLYIEEYKKRWRNDSEMVEYCIGQNDYFLELGGHLIYFEKRSIKKDFCFGYGQNGISNEEDRERADRMTQHSRTNEKYFINENLKPYNEILKELKDPSYKAYYNTKYNDSKLAEIGLSDGYHFYQEELDRKQQLIAKERAEIIKIYEMLKDKFSKRLNTYLKKYSLSKIHSWSYLVD